MSYNPFGPTVDSSRTNAPQNSTDSGGPTQQSNQPDPTAAGTLVSQAGGAGVVPAPLTGFLSALGLTPVMQDGQDQGSGPPPRFVAWATSVINARIGAGGARLVDPSLVNGLIDKLWKEGVVQSLYEQSSSNPLYLPSLLTQINQELLNPTEDPTIVSDYANMKESVGEGLTTTEQAALASATSTQAAPIPLPFNPQFNYVSGNDYGQQVDPNSASGGYGPIHLGVDYGTAPGTPLSSPFAGTVEVQTGIPYYGNLVLIHLDNGYTLAYGHVDHALIANGTRVNPGDAVAISGQNIGDSIGSVTLVEWRDPNGKLLNPHDVLDPIFKGTTFTQFAKNLGDPSAASGLAGSGQPTVNTHLDTEYPSIKSDWVKYFGSPPSPGNVYDVLAHGSSPQEWSDYIRSLPSHIGGVPVGTATDLRSLADSVSMDALGHQATDGVVASLYQQGFTSKEGVKLWYDENTPNQIQSDEQYKATYNAVAQANRGYTKGILNDQGVDPRVITPQVERLYSATRGPIPE